MNILDTQREIHATAKDKGWYTQAGRPVAELLVLIQCELSEAFEEYRNGHELNEVYFKGEKPEGFPIEIADAVIRIFDMCEYFNINLSGAMRLKMDYNKTRPHRHGGKKA